MKGKMKTIVFITCLSLCVIQCAPRSGIINSSLAETRTATLQVAANLKWGVDSGKSGSEDTIKFQSKYGTKGYMVLQDSNGIGTRYQANIYPHSLTSNALEKFFVEATKQEIDMEKGLLGKHKNKKKEYGTFFARNLISPTWGTHYALEKNVFFPVWTKNILVTSYALSDVISFATIVHGGITGNSNELKSGLIIAGIFRALGLTSVLYTFEYNRHVYLHYNFDQISLSF